MIPAQRHTTVFALIGIMLVVVFLADVALGPVRIPVKAVLHSFFAGEVRSSWRYIIIDYRLPKAITAVLCGLGLSLSGLLMQTLFRNPLAGPYVLGLSSGSSLGVAFVILGAGTLPAFLATFLLSSYGIIIASCLGSLFVLLAIILVSQRLRDTASILIIGLMFGSFTSAAVSVLTYFSTAEQLQKFTFWSMGNLGNLSWASVIILTVSVSIGIVSGIANIKSLDALLLGENYAKSLGLDYKKARLGIIFSTSILAGSITAFAGPIAFVGLAVPHMARLLFKTSRHAILFCGTLLLGATIMLLCDILSQLPGTDLMLPINAITSIIGAPVVIWLLLRRQKMTI